MIHSKSKKKTKLQSILRMEVFLFFFFFFTLSLILNNFFKEVVRFSANVGKYNDRKVLQDRILVLTNKRFYNFLKKPGIFQTNLKKKIDIKEIQAISISS